MLDYIRGGSMPYDESDAEYDHYMGELAEYARDEAQAKFYDELYNEAINHFTTSRLQAFYLAHPMVIQPSLDALNEARSEAYPIVKTKKSEN
jgi:hypothetical protein